MGLNRWKVRTCPIVAAAAAQDEDLRNQVEAVLKKEAQDLLVGLPLGEGGGKSGELEGAPAIKIITGVLHAGHKEVAAIKRGGLVCHLNSSATRENFKWEPTLAGAEHVEGVLVQVTDIAVERNGEAGRKFLPKIEGPLIECTLYDVSGGDALSPVLLQLIFRERARPLQAVIHEEVGEGDVGPQAGNRAAYLGKELSHIGVGVIPKTVLEGLREPEIVVEIPDGATGTRPVSLAAKTAAGHLDLGLGHRPSPLGLEVDDPCQRVLSKDGRGPGNDLDSPEVFCGDQIPVNGANVGIIHADPVKDHGGRCHPYAAEPSHI
jgi:hypothetical protein